MMLPQVSGQVIVSCESASAQVVSVGSGQITLEWPSGVIDNSSNFRWDGKFSLPIDVSPSEWMPYLVEPAVSELRPGDICTVSIPPTRLYVGHYEEYNPPRNLGWSPAPTAGMYVVPPEKIDQEDAGCFLYLGGAEPIRVEAIE
ncbi:hypothetical protein [Streptomyces sp. 3213.3]|uniref:hypothetical protein n=1 Tax=Streptomyces sp. 3213.3 TaxID=1855348 RepID=UPI001041E1DE|nr:hypothetical protein [Streptomyces sp. 3213.3]